MQTYLPNTLVERAFYDDNELKLPHSARSYIDFCSHEASLLPLEKKVAHFGFLLSRKYPLYNELRKDIDAHLETYSDYEDIAKKTLSYMLDFLRNGEDGLPSSFLIKQMNFKGMFQLLKEEILLRYEEYRDYRSNQLCYSFKAYHYDYHEIGQRFPCAEDTLNMPLIKYLMSAQETHRLIAEEEAKKNRKKNIISIQDLLKGRNDDFDKAKCVKILRHKDNRPAAERLILGETYEGSLYTLYRYSPQRFMQYQSEQAKGFYDGVDYIVSFLGEEGTTARFIGVYKITGKDDTYHCDDKEEYYTMVEADGFDILKERIIIDWGKGTLQWCQHYDTNIKYVIRIDNGMLSEDHIPPFVSYSDTNLPFEALKRIMDTNSETWRNKLQAVNGIYLIQDHANGKQYIGSTYKRGGMWERWKEYADTNGHGGDVELEKIMTDHPDYAKNLYWTILEILPINITPYEAIERESMYKEKFQTRTFGYNKN